MVNDMAGIRSFDVSSRLVLVKTLNLNFKRDRGVNIWCVFPGKYETRLEIKKGGRTREGAFERCLRLAAYTGVACLETDRFSGFSSHPNLKPPFHPGQCHVRLEIRSRFSSHLNIFSKNIITRIITYLPSYIFLPTK